MKFTGVSTTISAAHRGPEGVLHGHTWSVVAWFPYTGMDARLLKQELQQAISFMDHNEILAPLDRGEEMAQVIGQSLQGCVKVEVVRKEEGFYALWEL
jgi:6-pyruvoyl-tetrahydropterin synthase